jgi:hypothetical protein
MKEMKEEKKKRLNTRLESEGAEFLVLGRLLLEKIVANKAYVRYPGFDLTAVNPRKNTSAKIQVKSRFYTDWEGFIIKNFDCDFVVVVALNRRYKQTRKNGDNGIREPDFYVFPISYALKNRDPNNDWGKITKSRMKEFEKYKSRWDLISSFLEGKKR